MTRPTIGCSCGHQSADHNYLPKLGAFMDCKREGCGCEGFDPYESVPEIDFGDSHFIEDFEEEAIQ